MAILSAFQVIGQTVSLVTNATPATSQSATVGLDDFVLTQPPQSLRMINNGTSDIWIWLTKTAQTAAFPVAGTTEGGHAPGFRLKPGIIEVFAANVWAFNVEATDPKMSAFWVNTISAVASQQFDMTPGEGL